MFLGFRDRVSANGRVMFVVRVRVRVRVIGLG
jgi:hypothetical protein